jgi:AraC-like DNA-binding protein
MGISRTQLHRKLIALSGLSATMTIRQARINKAKTLLQRSDMNVSEVAYDVGFADPNYFSRIFSKEVGITPTEYARSWGVE